MVEQPEDSNQNNSKRKVTGSYQHNPNPKECIWKGENNVNIFEILRDDNDVIE